MTGYIIAFFIIILGIYLLGKILTRPIKLSKENIWQLADSSYEEVPKRPKEWTKEKNADNIYIDRLPIIADTVMQTYVEEETNAIGFKLVKVGGIPSGFFPIYTTIHNTEEHYLTTLYLSFHTLDHQHFLDIACMDPEFQLNEDNVFRCLFADKQEVQFQLSHSLGAINGWHYTSINISKEELTLFAQNKLDKWIMEKKSNLLCAVGALNFEIRPYVYKPEIQYTIQTMAQKIKNASSSH